MARKVLLSYPDFTQDFHLFTDASDMQFGGVIVQQGKPISFYSRKLTPPQKNYTVMEKELLSIVETTESHRSILVGFPLVFHSVHKNLSFNNFKSERVRRWRLLLEEYIYQFVYTPGKANIIADMISRYPMQPIGKNDIIEVNTLSPDDDDMPVDYALIALR